MNITESPGQGSLCTLVLPGFPTSQGPAQPHSGPAAPMLNKGQRGIPTNPLTGSKEGENKHLKLVRS